MNEKTAIGIPEWMKNLLAKKAIEESANPTVRQALKDMAGDVLTSTKEPAKQWISDVATSAKTPIKDLLAEAANTAKSHIDPLLEKVPEAAGGAVRKLEEAVGNTGREKVRELSQAALLGAGTGALSSPSGEAPQGALRGAVGGMLGGVVGKAWKNPASESRMVPALGALFGGAAGGLTMPRTKEIEESDMGHKFAGVTLDWYDDNGETLKQKFPTLDQVPAIIKEANVQPKEKVANEDFALIMVDQGYVFRKFACADAGTTAMSVVYFMEHGDKLPEDAQKTAAANLVNSCLEHGIMPPAALTKTAALAGMSYDPQNANILSLQKQHGANWKNVLAKQRGISAESIVPNPPKAAVPAPKVASIVDVTGQRPKPIIKEARPQHDEDYALVVEGERRYPIHNWEMVKKAEAYFHENKIRMHPEHRRQFATKLAQKSFILGYPLSEEITELGAAGYNRDDHLRDALDMRKVACAPNSGAREFLDDLFEKRANINPEVYAEVLRRFDIENGLDRGWDHVVLDPWASTFGVKTAAEVVWEEGAERVTRDALEDLAENHLHLVTQQFTYDVAKEFKKDPVAIFESMPVTHKKILARLASDAEADGTSEKGTNVPFEKKASGPVEFTDHEAGLEKLASWVGSHLSGKELEQLGQILTKRTSDIKAAIPKKNPAEVWKQVKLFKETQPTQIPAFAKAKV